MFWSVLSLMKSAKFVCLVKKFSVKSQDRSANIFGKRLPHFDIME